MSLSAQSVQPLRQPAATPAARQLYFDLANDQPGADDIVGASAFLQQQLTVARTLDSDLPRDMHDLATWMTERTDAVGRQYQQYLAGRKNGGPRAFFTSKAHALYFLKMAAPTKLVDGAWLYGTLQRWHDADFQTLIRIYLEELGDGLPEKNHVVLYKKLLATHGCDQWQGLADDHFLQGAIQLALAHAADDFVPELIGFNLGYEQLPLHLLITAYELNELGIDPYYFTLHITVDNATTGHAKNAMQGVLQLAPRVGDTAAFYQRVADGYRLNELGLGTRALIASFDVEQELFDILADKSTVGKNMHSDYCRVAGRTVNDWLSDPAQVPAFMAALEQAGWIKRGVDPEQSRFWRLIHGERADMFGVFSSYEQQVLRDWIAAAPVSADATAQRQLRAPTFRAQQRIAQSGTALRDEARPSSVLRPVLRDHGVAGANDSEGFGADLRLLEERLAALDSKEAVMRTLCLLMSPGTHHTSAGLMATRIFSRLLGGAATI